MPFFEAGMFDIVIDGQCLHCLIGEDRGACLAEVRRILRPGGVFFVSSMVAPPKSDDARACFDADRGWLLRDGKPYRTLKSLDDLASELSQAGFAIEEHTLGICAVGVALHDPLGNAVAISVPVPSQRFQNRQALIAERLVATKHALESRMNSAAA